MAQIRTAPSSKRSLATRMAYGPVQAGGTKKYMRAHGWWTYVKKVYLPAPTITGHLREESNADMLTKSTARVLKDGCVVTVTPSATGLGTHTRWIYPEDDSEDESQGPPPLGYPPPSPMTSIAQHKPAVDYATATPFTQYSLFDGSLSSITSSSSSSNSSDLSSSFTSSSSSLSDRSPYTLRDGSIHVTTSGCSCFNIIPVRPSTLPITPECTIHPANSHLQRAPKKIQPGPRYFTYADGHTRISFTGEDTAIMEAMDRNSGMREDEIDAIMRREMEVLLKSRRRAPLEEDTQMEGDDDEGYVEGFESNERSFHARQSNYARTEVYSRETTVDAEEEICKLDSGLTRRLQQQDTEIVDDSVFVPRRSSASVYPASWTRALRWEPTVLINDPLA